MPPTAELLIYHVNLDNTKLPEVGHMLHCDHICCLDCLMQLILQFAYHTFITFISDHTVLLLLWLLGHDSLLYLSWHDSAWIPILNQHNVMDYFSERSNPFYDRQCNNEVIKMQRLNPEQMRLVVTSTYDVSELTIDVR